MAQTMQRVVLKKTGCLECQTVEKESAKPGEVLVKVECCGVCGSDLTIYNGKHPWAISPLIMGHEFSGVVETLGRGVDSPAIGTRVAILPHRVCGKCFGCKQNSSNLCENLKCMGAEAHGGHAEYVSIPAKMAIPVQGKVSFEEAALLEPACVGYHGIRRLPKIEDKTICVVGSGPIGVFAAQSAKAIGAKKVFVGDLDSERLQLAFQLGADKVFNLKDKSLAKALEDQGVDAKDIDAFADCVGLEGQVLDQILAVARRNTDIVMVGVLRRNYDIPHLPDFVQHEISLHGTTMYNHQDYAQMIDLMNRKIIRIDGMITHRFNLDEIPEVFKFLNSKAEPYFKVMLKISQ